MLILKPPWGITVQAVAIQRKRPVAPFRRDHRSTERGEVRKVDVINSSPTSKSGCEKWVLVSELSYIMVDILKSASLGIPNKQHITGEIPCELPKITKRNL